MNDRILKSSPKIPFSTIEKHLENEPRFSDVSENNLNLPSTGDIVNLRRLWSRPPQPGVLVWIRYEGTVSCGRIVSSMPSFNMFTVRPDDGGLTRFITRGIEDILPITGAGDCSLPPSEEDWKTVIGYQPDRMLTHSINGEISPDGTVCSNKYPSIHSPLYIDASVESSLYLVQPNEDAITGHPPSSSFTDPPLSSSTASFNISQCHSESDDFSICQRPHSNDPSVQPITPVELISSTGYDPPTERVTPEQVSDITTLLLQSEEDRNDSAPYLHVTSSSVCDLLTSTVRILRQWIGSLHTSSTELDILKDTLLRTVKMLLHFDPIFGVGNREDQSVQQSPPTVQPSLDQATTTRQSVISILNALIQLLANVCALPLSSAHTPVLCAQQPPPRQQRSLCNHCEIIDHTPPHQPYYTNEGGRGISCQSYCSIHGKYSHCAMTSIWDGRSYCDCGQYSETAVSIIGQSELPRLTHLESSSKLPVSNDPTENLSADLNDLIEKLSCIVRTELTLRRDDTRIAASNHHIPISIEDETPYVPARSGPSDGTQNVIGWMGDSTVIRQQLYPSNSCSFTVEQHLAPPQIILPQPISTSPILGRRKQRTKSETVTTNKSDLTGTGRPDVKKCRRVYGIENRSLWCNQCRWKKACRRFPGSPAHSMGKSLSRTNNNNIRLKEPDRRPPTNLTEPCVPTTHSISLVPVSIKSWSPTPISLSAPPSYSTFEPSTV